MFRCITYVDDDGGGGGAGAGAGGGCGDEAVHDLHRVADGEAQRPAVGTGV